MVSRGRTGIHFLDRIGRQLRSFKQNIFHPHLRRHGPLACSYPIRTIVAGGLIVLWPASLRASAAPAKTGEYTITGSPLSNQFMSIVFTRLVAVPAYYGGWPNKGVNGHDPENSQIKSHFSVYVPPTYRPDGTWGLMVYVFPGDKAGIPPSWKAICQRHRLLLIVPQNAGNNHWAPWREALTLKAALEMHRLYKLNTNRIYTGGSSGGGRDASEAPVLFPDVFTGEISNCGADFVDKPGNVDVYNDQPQMLSRAKSRCRFFLFTGTKDVNEQETRAVYKWMKQLGFRYVTFYDQPGAHHAQMSDTNFEKGIDVLDAPLAVRVPKEIKRAGAWVKQGQLGRAMWLLNRAAMIAPGTSECQAAQGALDKLTVGYSKALADVQAIVAGGDKAKSNIAITKFAQQYLPWASHDVEQLRRQILHAQ